MGGLSAWHWLIVIGVFVLLFGAKKLPDAARSLGKSMRIFKSEIKEMQADSKSDQPEQPTQITSERVVEPTDPSAQPTGSGSSAQPTGSGSSAQPTSDKRPA